MAKERQAAKKAPAKPKKAAEVDSTSAVHEEEVVTLEAGISSEKAPIEATKEQAPEPNALAAAIELLSDEGYLLVKQEEAVALDDSPVIVIPYKKSAAAGRELLYALRAWDKYYPGCKIIVVGDSEDWFSQEVQLIEAPHLSENPQIDVAIKMLMAIASDKVPDNFIWSNDDILPVSPIHHADIELLKCNGRLSSNKPSLNGVYAQNRQRTIDKLKELGLPDWDYSTHTPYYFNKQKLVEVIERVHAEEQGHLVSSLYFNLHYPEITPVTIKGDATCFFTAYIYRENPPQSVVQQVLGDRKFINYNDRGYKAIQAELELKYPEKSKFEL